MTFNRWSKAWVIITLGALMAFDVRWLYGVIISVYQISIGVRAASWWRFWLDYTLTGLVGDVVRLLGVCLAFYAVYLVWGHRHESFLGVRKFVSVAVLCEAVYFLTLTPITLIEGARGVFPLLMAGYLLQILLVSPPLIALSVKIWRYTESARAEVVKWAAIAGTFYLAGIWVNNVFRWVGITDIGSLFSGTTAFGFLDTLATLSLAVAFAAAGTHDLIKDGNQIRSMKLFAFALVMVGLAFALFVRYSAVTGTLVYAVLVEIWPVTLLGLGLSMLKTEK